MGAFRDHILDFFVVALRNHLTEMVLLSTYNIHRSCVQ